MLCSIKHDYDDYTSARSSSSLANPLTGCYSCLKINHTPVKHWNIIKNVDSSLMFVKPNGFIKLWINILRATKTDSVFMQHVKTNSIFASRVAKIQSILCLLQKPSRFLQSSLFLLKSYNGFYDCYKNQDDFCSVQTRVNFSLTFFLDVGAIYLFHLFYEPMSS